MFPPCSGIRHLANIYIMPSKCVTVNYLRLFYAVVLLTLSLYYVCRNTAFRLSCPSQPKLSKKLCYTVAQRYWCFCVLCQLHWRRRRGFRRATKLPAITFAQERC